MSAFTPRPYQIEACDRTFQAIADGKRPLIRHATGLGKTELFIMTAERYQRTYGRNVLVMVAGQDLVKQAAARYHTRSGVRPLVEMGRMKVDRENVSPFRDTGTVVASVDSLYEHRLESFAPDTFGLIITDEAHHATADKYVKVYSHFSGAASALYTATPNRHDGVKLIGTVADVVAHDYPAYQAIRDGWLADLAVQHITLNDVSIAIRPTRKADWSDAEVASVVDHDRICRGCADEIVRAAKDRPTIVFCASVAHARHMTDCFNAIRPDSAQYVASYRFGLDGAKRKEDNGFRDDQFAKFAAGKLQFLCNFGVITEGVDLPNAACIAVLRFTKNRSLLIQMIGRGMRKYAGKPHDDCLVLDFAGSSSLGLLDPIDLLGADIDADDWIASRAKQLAMKGATAVNALEQSRQEAYRMRIEAIQKAFDTAMQSLDLLDACGKPLRDAAVRQIRQAMEVRVDSVARSVDPWTATESPESFMEMNTHAPPSDKQARWLRRLIVSKAGPDMIRKYTLAHIQTLSQKYVGHLIGYYRSL